MMLSYIILCVSGIDNSTLNSTDVGEKSVQLKDTGNS